MEGSKGGGAKSLIVKIVAPKSLPGPPPLKNHKNIGFPSNTGPDPLKNHKVTKPTFNVGPSSARQRNADVGPLMVIIGSSLPSSTKKKKLVVSLFWGVFFDNEFSSAHTHTHTHTHTNMNIKEM